MSHKTQAIKQVAKDVADEFETGLDSSWLKDLEQQQQPTCSIEDNDECTSCGS